MVLLLRLNYTYLNAKSSDKFSEFLAIVKGKCNVSGGVIEVEISLDKKKTNEIITGSNVMLLDGREHGVCVPLHRRILMGPAVAHVE